MAYREAENLMKEIKEKKNWYVNRGLKDYWEIKKSGNNKQNENKIIDKVKKRDKIALFKKSAIFLNSTTKPKSGLKSKGR